MMKSTASLVLFEDNERLSGNPSIALDNAHHTRRGGAHWFETQIRRRFGLGKNEFHASIKRELDITQGALRKQSRCREKSTIKRMVKGVCT